MTVPDAVRLIQDTPASRHSEFAEMIWHRRRARGTNQQSASQPATQGILNGIRSCYRLCWLRQAGPLVLYEAAMCADSAWLAVHFSSTLPRLNRGSERLLTLGEALGGPNQNRA
jgi:hypothetical protein